MNNTILYLTRSLVKDGPANNVEEYLHIVRERLSHKPSFECFGGHFEFAPPLPQFWEIHWDTLRAD